MDVLQKYQPLIVPAMLSPDHRVCLAIQNGAEKNILIVARGGAGDQVCAKPTLDHIFRYFVPYGCEISLAAHDGLQELFRDLPFKRIFDLREEMPIWDNYYVIETINDLTAQDTWVSLADEFFNHCGIQAGNYAAILATRGQLPVAEREIVFDPLVVKAELVEVAAMSNAVVVHPGKHWQSKTFPKWWWDDVLLNLRKEGLTPIIIGANRKDTGTVDVETEGCVDLRGQTTMIESIWLLQRSKVLLTNDSSPLHMACSRSSDGQWGKAWIGFVATIKHPDYIMHWRFGKWAWRQKNLSLGGIWTELDCTPGAENPKFEGVEKVETKTLLSWLPEPIDVAKWAKEKHAAWTE